MPIPFYDHEDIQELGIAAFFHAAPITRKNAEQFGALLLINARGEPLEFVYNRIELMNSILWRPSDRDQAAVRRLALTLFQTATLTPSLLLCRANIVSPHLFNTTGPIQMEIPVGRIAEGSEMTGYASSDQKETFQTANSEGNAVETHIFWSTDPPTGTASDLLARLAQRGLLLEPFERIEKGLTEVYGRV